MPPASLELPGTPESTILDMSGVESSTILAPPIQRYWTNHLNRIEFLVPDCTRRNLSCVFWSYSEMVWRTKTGSLKRSDRPKQAAWYVCFGPVGGPYQAASFGPTLIRPIHMATCT